MGHRFGDEIGEHTVVETHSGACGGKNDRFVELARRQRGQDVGARRDQLTEPGVLQGPVEQVGSHGGDEPHVDGRVVGGTQDDVDERVTVAGRARVQHSSNWSITTDHPSEVSSDVIDRVHP